MRKLYIFSVILSLAVLFSSCETKDADVKKALKEDALSRGDKYELLNYKLIESVLISAVEDSISSTRAMISSKEWRLSADSARLKKLYLERSNCQREKATTIPSLVSTWNSLISDYDKMIIEAEKDIENAKNYIEASNEKIQHYNEILSNAEDPIAYYVYYHNYKLDGKVCEDEVLLSTKNIIIK
jgi:peptidoglycan hydrolase CwlO-like protein